MALSHEASRKAKVRHCCLSVCAHLLKCRYLGMDNIRGGKGVLTTGGFYANLIITTTVIMIVTTSTHGFIVFTIL